MLLETIDNCFTDAKSRCGGGGWGIDNIDKAATLHDGEVVQKGTVRPKSLGTNASRRLFQMLGADVGHQTLKSSDECCFTG